jgi:hypothetical protein
MEDLEVQIKDLKNAYTNVIEAMNNISDVDGLDEEYTYLDTIAQLIDDKRTSFESELEDLKEEAYYKENEQQWKREQKEQEYAYWQSQF